ncbi:MAG: glycosyltransferase family 4 protein [Ignavibacteria bacterium]|nr:MAG: glycosyltransferase family 4 protein [Ignavibacteria bacterium]
MRGGEKCLEVLCDMFPSAPIHTLVAFPDQLSATINRHSIRTSFLQRMPMVETRYRHYLPLFPTAIERFNMDKYELIVSSSHAVAKGIRPAEGALHISYVHTPMRYVWDMFDQYFNVNTIGSARLAFIRLVAAQIRKWDVKTSVRVHHFIANSAYVAERINRIYGRDAEVIHPPVETSRFATAYNNDGRFLIVSALVPYKRVDLAVETANALQLPLRIIGDGPERLRLLSLAGPTVTIEGWLSDPEIENAYAACRALLFPGEEDFGIVPVEAMACGKPVIAFGRGGARETVVEGLSGTLFPEQTVSSMSAAIQRFERMEFDADSIRTHAEAFDRSVYHTRMLEYITERWRIWDRSPSR